MPIYDQSYRAYKGEFEPHTMRWWVIASAGLKHYLSRRLFLIFLFVALIPAIVHGVLVWTSHRLDLQGFAAIDALFFRRLMTWESPFLMLICIWPGAVLISRDLQTNAIQLYLSKPLSVLDYVLGKFAIIAGIGAILIPAPALLIFMMEIALSDDLSFISSYFWVPLSIMGYSAVVITGAGLLSLAVSSITHSSRYAGLLFFAVVFFTSFVSIITIGITGDGLWSVLSIPFLVEQAGGVFFGGAIEHGRHTVAAILAYAVLIFLTTTILRRRVKAVEIVT